MSTVHTAADFMRRELVTLQPDTPVNEGARGLLQHRITGMPVVDGEQRYLGMFSEKCCFRALSPAAEEAHGRGTPVPSATGFMAKQLLVLRPETDVFEAIDQILDRKVSGAPVLDEHERFLGIFSEKTAMRVLITSAYESVPGGTVGSYMNPDQERVIGEGTTLLEATEKFKNTSYRRLPVLDGTTLLGQVSRRDVLRAQAQLTQGSRGGAGADAAVRHMDRDARTIAPGDDLLTIAQIFETTPYRRLPVLANGKLVGQVSRRDLLRKAATLLRPEPVQHQAEWLYLSPLLDSVPPEVSRGR